jgi:predicted TIM-barrel fold metal-dependent hydrolase
MVLMTPWLVSVRTQEEVIMGPNKGRLSCWERVGMLIAGVLLAISFISGSQQAAWSPEHEEMSLAELQKMPKIDVHAHISDFGNTGEKQFIGFLEKHNFKWLDICVVGTEWQKLQKKVTLAEKFHQAYPQRIAWATSFNLTNWGNPDWKESALAMIGQGFAQGAVAVKFWKEIGMVLKDPNGHYVMIDDPRFDPLFDLIQKSSKTAVAHIGEPYNCWLPLDSMTVDGDRHYFKEHPQYHGYLHPEIPGYWEQIKARDHVLAKHPNLRVVGCHLGSLEFDVDELAKRLDLYPHFAVDTAARIVHFQVQDREKVRNFILKYQGRLLYGTDNEMKAGGNHLANDLKALEEVYTRDYRYFATDQEIELPEIRANFKVRGLALPASVLKKIYYENAVKWFQGI